MQIPGPPSAALEIRGRHFLTQIIRRTVPRVKHPGRKKNIAFRAGDFYNGGVVIPRRRLVFPLVLFVLLTLLLIAGGIHYYFRVGEHIEVSAAERMTAIADLKTAILDSLRRERLADISVIAADPSMDARVIPFLQKDPRTAPGDPEIQAWIESITASKGYLNAALIDAAGRVRITAGEALPHINAYTERDLAWFFSFSGPAFFDFHSNPDIGLDVHLDLFAPIVRRDAAGKTVRIGVYIFRLDPAASLYPLLKIWPTQSRSAESILIRRDGEDVLYLNELRTRPGPALEIRVPASSDTPGALALRGRTGVVKSRDERGVPVMAVIKPVPDTAWFLIVQENLAEIREPLIARISSLAAMIVILWFGFGVMILFWIKRREALHFKSRYETEHERLALIQHFEYLHKYANDVVFLADSEFRLIEANDRALAVYAYTREEILRLRISDLRSPESRAEFAGQMDEARRRGGLIFETRHRRKNGEVFPVEVSLRLIDIGGALYYQGILRDISERKRNEARIMAALREKEVLLREIHHRVKNNMQVISSLLHLQSSKFTEAEVLDAFRESRSRIKSMALVHEKLYGTKDFSRIDFADYIKSLTSSVFASHAESGRIGLRLDLDRTHLDINTAVPCGLIVNELILNALKHAFPNNREGIITVELRENENDMMRLTVRDDGIGLAEGIDPERTESLGFQIISLLAGQMEGHLDIRRELGTAVSLFFKASAYREPS